MSYYQIQEKGQYFKSKDATIAMASGGINKRDLPQFLSLKYAQDIVNYHTLANGRLVKRKGLERLFEESSSGAITLLEKYTDDIYIFGYSNKVKAYTISTDTITSIKADFTTTDPFSGVRYGDYFFVCNGGDKIGRITQTLNYDGQSTDFTVGLTVTGATSGATAIILEDSDSGATGTLTLGNISGTFQDNEALSDPDGGDADANGTVGFTYTEISDAPKAKVLYAFGPRLFCGNTDNDPTEIIGAAVDDGTNPPFTDWTPSTSSTDATRVIYRRGGAIKAISSLGSQVIGFGENGKFAFRINVLDSGGSLVQDVVVDYERIDFGSERAVINTSKGVFYANENGLWQMVNTGETNVPYSEQEGNISVSLLGRDYFDDIDLDNADMVYDDKRNLLLLTCEDDSDTNNLVIVYDLERKAFSTIRGWQISRFLKDDTKIYGGSSVTFGNEMRVWEIFKTNSDDGTDIWTKYKQELNVGALYTRKNLKEQYFQGRLSPSTSLNVAFDIYDTKGNLVEKKKQITWSLTDNEKEVTEYGTGTYGSSAYGGVDGTDELVEDFAGASAKISNFQRLILHITENSEAPHEINWVSLIVEKEIPITRRNLTVT